MSLSDDLKEEEPKSDAKTQKKRIDALEKQVEEYERQIERYRKPRVRIGASPIKQKAAGDFVRVIIPDTHGSMICKEAAGAMLADLAVLNPSEVILLGDHLDASGFLAQHHTMGVVADTEYTYEDDVAHANDFLDQVQQAAPNARIDYLMGNHEERIEKWCITMALRNTTDSEMLRRMVAPESVLSLKKRGIPWYNTTQRYDDLIVPGTIKRGKCHFTHGFLFGVHAAASTLKAYSANVVFGHTHRIQSHSTRSVGAGIASAWNIGCLCQLQPTYRNRSLTDWNHGYAVQFCQENGNFSHLTIHIIEGESFLMPMIEQIKG